VWHHRLAYKVRDIDGALMLCTLAFLSLMLGLGAAGASVLAGALLGWRAWRA
jgi:sorbitol-specific phosphotransferase system component IIBC